MNQQLPSKFTITSRSIAVYPAMEYSLAFKKRHSNSLKNLEFNDHEGKISSAARKNIQQYINFIDSTSEWKQYYSERDEMFFSFRVNFITLTLPSTQVHPDQFIKRHCLGQFITEWKKRNPALRYFWRAEKQGNGNIHFHILSNQYYHYKAIREDWNRITNKYGYVDKYSNDYHGITFKSYCSKEMARCGVDKWTAKSRWKAGNECGWINPNSTDVHAIKHVKNVASYVGKYCTKDTVSAMAAQYTRIVSKVGNRMKYKVSIADRIKYNSQLNIISGKQYGCDEYTKSYSNLVIDECPDIKQFLSDVISNQQFSLFKDDFISVYKFDVHYLLKRHDSDLGRMYSHHIDLYNTAHERGQYWFSSPFERPKIVSDDSEVRKLLDELLNDPSPPDEYNLSFELASQIPLPL